MTRIPLLVLETVFLVVLGVIGLAQGVYIALRPDPFATYDRIGPGLSLVSISSALLITVIFYTIAHRQEARDQAKRANWRGLTGNLGRSTALIVGYIVLLDVVGLVPATTLFLCAILKLLGVETWLKSAILSIVFALAVYLIFVWAFHMELPTGWFVD